MKKILILATVSLVGAIAQAQSVSPVYVEGKSGKKPLKGQFTVQNLGLVPMPVVVEPKQLQIIDGKAMFGALQPGTTVTLADSSAVVPPRSSRTFDYQVSCAKECMVMLLSGMTTGRTKEGMQIRLWLPSSTYLCETQKGCRERIKKAAGLQ